MRKTLSILVAILLVSFGKLFSQDKNKEVTVLEIFKSGKCNSCHSSENVGLMKKENQKAPDLSNISDNIVDVEFLTKYLKKEKKIKDKNHPLKFNGNDEDLKKLGNWLLSFKNRIAIKDSTNNMKIDSN